MTGMRKFKVAIWTVVLLYLAVIVLTNREQVELALLPGTAASMRMWEGLLAVVMLLAGFAIGFFFGRASMKQ